MVHFSVRDTGIGIPADKQHLVFEEFRQIEEGSTRKFGGSGLGLAITRHLVEMHGGRIWLESEVGVGTTFHLTFPVAEPERPAVTASPLSDNEQPVILIIDDDPQATETLCKHLASNGYNVTKVNNGPEGLTLAREEHPTLIVLDAMMPGMTGWQTLEALKADPATARTPVIMLGITDEEAHAVPVGTSEILNKPVEPKQLLDAVQRTLDAEIQSPILIVDDSESDRKLLQDILENAGYRVVGLDGGQAARDWLVQHDACLVILDLMMPGVSGFDVLRFIRDNQALADIPVLVVSAKELTPEEERFLRRRYADLLQKGGLIPDRLLAEVKESLKYHE